MIDLSRRNFMRGLFAMPAVVAINNIMPVRSIERFAAMPSPSRTVFVHPKMFDDLLGYIEHFNGELVQVTGVTPEMLGGASALDPWGGDLRAVIKDGVLGIDWPAENVRVERVELLDVAAAELSTSPALVDPGHIHNVTSDPHSHYATMLHPAEPADYHGEQRRLHRGLVDRAKNVLLQGEIGEYRGVRLVRGT